MIPQNGTGHEPVSCATPARPASEQSHLLNSTAHSSPESECLTLQKKAWLRATRSTPSRTGMLSAWTA